jgi:hypothetical protein
VTSTDQIKALDRNEIRALLKELANAPPPKDAELSAGAMCYKPASPPKRADYVCPKCGERTVYDESDKTLPLEQAEKGSAALVKWGVPSCRRTMQTLRKLTGDAITLDESQFCRKCSPQASSPKLVLHILFKGEKETRDIERVTCDDLQLLTDFFARKATGEGDRDARFPLKDGLPRLQELLGVKADE